jgi:glycosyltransferase involved in cell wall biosynthesis
VRILVVSQYFWPENFRVNDLVTELAGRGHQVTVLTGIPNYPGGRVFPEYAADRGAYRQFGKVTVARVPLLVRGRGGIRLLANYLSFAVSASLVGLWKLRKRQFDVIFAFEPSPITVGVPAALMRAAKGAPLAFWVLDLWPETLKAIGVVRARWSLRLIGTLVRWIYARCDLILAQSRSFIPQIAVYCADASRIRYFPSWAEPFFEATTVSPAPEIETRLDCFTVLFAGNVGDAQDFPAILDAAELLRGKPHIRWVVVGDGRLSEWVKREVMRRGLDSCFLMPGRFPVERMPEFFRHADALLVSLKKEPIFSMTIPGKLQAYLAAGIPVVAMLDGEGADVVRDAGAGVTCAAGDAVGLADSVVAMASMTRGQRDEMGRNGVALSAREFDRKTLIDKLEGWLAELQSSHPSPGMGNTR